MKQLLSILIIFSLVFSPSAFAFQYVEQRPEAIQSIQSNGIGATYNFMGPDGGIRRMTVTGFESSSDGKGLVVRLDRADNVIIVNFDSEEEFSFRPVDPAAKPSDLDTPPDTVSASSSNSAPQASGSAIDFSSLGAGLSVGAGSGLMAGIQTGIIESTGYVQRIQEAYARIAELQAKMGADLARIEEARINLRNQAIVVMLKASDPTSIAELSAPSNGEAAKERIRYVVQNAAGSGDRIRWLSQDQEFLKRARSIESTLRNAHVRDEIDQTFHDISKRSLIEADRNSFLGNQDAADFLLSVAKESADILVGLDPFTGTARSLYEAITGENLITGVELSTAERVIATLGVVTAGYAIKTSKTFQILENLSKKIAPKALKTLRAVSSFFRKTGHGFELVSEARALRKVNFRSSVDPSWGLTPTHLKKHFFGESKFALNKIDPAGNADTWMQNLTDLIQRPVNQKLENGALDIHGVFSKADGSGSYKMGVRLWPNEDGTFELITVLTKQ